ncbi:MAG: hypothetical protein KIT74_03315 [Fimbriimonadales bacterium]|nr:hypothetical protein [Fimbriimonadales bacterium]
MKQSGVFIVFSFAIFVVITTVFATTLPDREPIDSSNHMLVIGAAFLLACFVATPLLLSGRTVSQQAFLSRVIVLLGLAEGAAIFGAMSRFFGGPIAWSFALGAGSLVVIVALILPKVVGHDSFRG